MSNPERIREVGILLAAKVIIAVTAGYIIDIFFQNQLATVKESGNLCKDCGCDEEDAGIWKPAWHHTIRIFIYLFIFTGTFKSLHRNLRD